MERGIKAQLARFLSGDARRAHRFMGCHPASRGGARGYVFRVWAPAAGAVSVVGDWNAWDAAALPMRPLAGGVWEAFTPAAAEGDAYQYAVQTCDGAVLRKTDPFGFRTQTLPGVASRVCTLAGYAWQDAAWRQRQRRRPYYDRPMNIYELHFGSWRHKPDGSPYDYDELAELLVPYLKQMGYTHVELLPLAEHPYTPSWGYQVTGYFAPTARYGAPQQLMRFVERCHQAGLGVLLDWVPAHFPCDAHGLVEFDGSCCFEPADPLLREQPQWGTRAFDYGRGAVQSFLISSAVYWLEQYHFDGLRVDAVASMLYLDFGGRPYRPNPDGGTENPDAIAFLRRLNQAVAALCPGALMIAEDSSAFPLVTHPVETGGLGFQLKWNMGWMNDTLRYMQLDPLWRSGSHTALNFTMTYAYTEHFILPLSHDEVVHLKRSMLEKMPGDEAAKLASLRVYYGFLMSHPGKKLSFMGNELGQHREWCENRELDWFLLRETAHSRLQAYVRALNHFYLTHSSLWSNDSDWDGFHWIVVDDCENNVVVFRRIDRRGRELIVVCNFCPVLRRGYRFGLPRSGCYAPVFNSDEQQYGGTGVPLPTVRAERIPSHGLPCSGEFTLAPLSATFYQRTQSPASRAARSAIPNHDEER